MGWLDKVKQTMEKAAGEAGDVAAVGKMRLEIRTLNGKLEGAFEAIGARAYELHETGLTLPAELTALCGEADKIADEIKAKEQEVERIKAEA